MATVVLYILIRYETRRTTAVPEATHKSNEKYIINVITTYARGRTFDAPRGAREPSRTRAISYGTITLELAIRRELRRRRL